jgi:group I intron endonuclease
MKAYIYKITNLVNNKIYIGQTFQTIKKRWYHHCYPNKNSKSPIAAAIKKQGKENFKIEIIEEINYENEKEAILILNGLETKYIASCNSLCPIGYNVLEFGGTTKGRKWSEETRAKYKATKTGMKYREKTPEELKIFGDNVAKGHFKPIICNETGQTWNSVKECAEFFEVKSKQISRVLKGQRKHLKWKYSFSYLPKSKQL